jgi:RNA polymerase sigma factor (sigma-70 family)
MPGLLLDSFAQMIPDLTLAFGHPVLSHAVPPHYQLRRPVANFRPLAASCSVMDAAPDEYDLALRARDGDRDALAELVQRARGRLFALAYAELRHYDDAQDAVASALLKICRHVGELREPGSIRAWMQSVVRNEVRQLERRRGALWASLEEAEGAFESEAPVLLRLDIERALQGLPTSEAEAVRLFYLDDLSLEEVSRHTGRPRGTVGSWLHRGRRRLAELMEDYAPVPLPQLETAPATEEKGQSIMAWQRFTERARAVYLVGVEEARRRGHPQLGTEHVLLGLVTEGDPDTGLLSRSVAVKLLVRLGLPHERVRREVEPHLTPGSGPLDQDPKLTDEGRRVVDLAYEAAKETEPDPDRWYVGTEHLLLALLREEHGVAGQILRDLGASPDAVLRELPALAEKGNAVHEASQRLKEAKDAFYAWLAGV